VAGRNQHHIPQSVLKGFARDPNEKLERVWHYRRGAPVAPKLTTDVAAQHDFYSKPSQAGEKTLDDKITEYERVRFTPLLWRLRSVPAGGNVEHDDAAEYLGHLLPRSDHMRRMFSETMQRFLGGATEFMSDPSRVAQHLGLEDMEAGGEALAQLRKRIAKSGVAPILALGQIPTELVERLAFALVREFGPVAFERASAAAVREFQEMSLDVKSRVKEAHADALERVGAGHRMPRLEAFTFTIEETQSELLLPDCVAVGFDHAGRASPFVMVKREDLALIIAPLSPHRALVGRVGPEVAIPDDAVLAEKLASCSHMFFIAASDHFRDLHGRLGAVSDPEVDRIAGTAFARKTELLPAREPLAAQARSFELTTPADFTEEEKAALGDLISDVASDVHSVMAIECLENVTVMDTGTLDDCGLYLVDHGGMSARIQDGKLRLRLFVPRAAAEALARDSSPEDYTLALQVLVSALTKSAAASRLDHLSDEYFRNAGTDSHPALHYRGVGHSLPTYLALRALRVIGDDPRLFTQMDGCAAAALTQADARIEELKAAFEAKPDADTFMYAAGECVTMVTCAAAAAAGRLGGDLDAFPLFQQGLRDRGLLSWFRRFARDLENFWDEPRSVRSPRSWGIHSERLLMSWAVATWATEGGCYTLWLPPPLFVQALKAALQEVAARMEEMESAADQERA